MLDPIEYDAAERAALDQLPNRVISACQPVAFNTAHYPTRVSSVKGLWRFANVMQEGRIRREFQQLNGLTGHEMDLIRKVTDAVVTLTTGLCGRPVVPTASLVSSIATYRAIKNSRPGSSVFEIGGGSGYVGALLIADGFDYWSTDVSQGFFLWQEHLFNALGALPDRHLTWWEWLTREPILVDVIVANHVLNEMHPYALAYFLRKTAEMLNIGGILLSYDLGSEVLRTCDETSKICETFGIFPCSMAV